MKNTILYFAFCLFLISSCKTNEDITIIASNNKDSKIQGLASPIYLPNGGGEILLSDYFNDFESIDSTSTNNAYKSVFSDNKRSINITPNNSFGSIENLRVWSNGIAYDIPIFKSEKEKIDFTYEDPQHKVKSVMLKSAFNGWVPERSVFEFSNGKWQYTQDLNPGNHQYLLVVDGKEILDPSNPEKASNGMGGFNSVVRIGQNIEKAIIKTNDHTGNKISIRSTQSLDRFLVFIENTLIDPSYIESKEKSYSVNLKNAPNGKSSLRIYGADQNGRSNDIFIPLKNGKPIMDPDQLSRSDFHTQIMYFLMVDRFVDGDIGNTKPVNDPEIHPKANHFGGDLQGVIDKIDDGYFEALGTNTIWLSPITQNPEAAYGLWPNPKTKFSGYHGYWPISNSKIDYRFGNRQVMEELIDKAHNKGMNVILDYVANHVHEEHPLYKAHPEWATDLYLPDGSLNTEKWDSHRLTTWFDTFMPSLDFSNPEVVEAMSDSASFWVTDYELDGFRHDATKHIQEEFWRTLTQKIKSKTDRPIFQIGETYGSYDLIRSYINTGMLDAQFDFNMYDASVSAFAKDESSFEQLASTLQEGLNYFGYHNMMGNITGNQDRARFISYASGDVKFEEDAKVAGWTREVDLTDSTAYKKLEMLHAFNLFVPGIPCIYYGDEYGAPGANDPDNRRMMRFDDLKDQENNLKEKVSDLAKKRRNNLSLLYGTTEIIRADQEIFILQRSYFDEVATIIFNKGKTAFDFEGINVSPKDYALHITKK